MRQLTQAVTRLQEVDYYYATISHKRHLADTIASSQWIAENPNVGSISVLTGGGAESGRPSGQEVRFTKPCGTVVASDHKGMWRRPVLCGRPGACGDISQQ